MYTADSTEDVAPTLAWRGLMGQAYQYAQLAVFVMTRVRQQHTTVPP